MAVNERTYTRSYEYQPLYTGAAAFQPAYPERESEESRKVKRTRERPKSAVEAEVQPAGQSLTIQELRQLIVMAVVVGILLIGMLVVNAYAVSIQCSINELTKAKKLIIKDLNSYVRDKENIR